MLFLRFARNESREVQNLYNKDIKKEIKRKGQTFADHRKN